MELPFADMFHSLLAITTGPLELCKLWFRGLKQVEVREAQNIIMMIVA